MAWTPPGWPNAQGSSRARHALPRPGGLEGAQAVCARPEHEGSQLTFGRRRDVVQKPRLTAAGPGSDDAAAVAGRRSMTAATAPARNQASSHLAWLACHAVLHERRRRSAPAVQHSAGTPPLLKPFSAESYKSRFRVTGRLCHPIPPFLLEVIDIPPRRDIACARVDFRTEGAQHHPRGSFLR